MTPLPAWPTLDSPFGKAFFTRLAHFYNCLRAKGLENPACVGILANGDMESAFNPTAVGDTDTAFNVFQWHWSPRGQNIFARTGIDIRKETSPARIVDALWFELTTTYPFVLQAMKSATTGGDAAGKFCDSFEGAGAAEAHQRRQDDAMRIEQFIAENMAWIVTQGTDAPTSAE